MAEAQSNAANAASGYAQLATRVQKIINSQSAQRAKAALLFKAADESAEDWDKLLEEIGETDNVTIAYRDDGGVQIFWVVPADD